MKNKQVWDNWIKTRKVDEQKLNEVHKIFDFIDKNFPELVLEIKWNEAMFSMNKTFIIAISVFKNHISLAPEKYAIKEFYNELSKQCELTENTIKMNYNNLINFNLLKEIIDFKILDKKDCKTYFKVI